MIPCPQCGRDVPVVVGAATQACPHCGHEFTPDVPALAPPPRVDPVAALGHAWRFAKRGYHLALLLWLPALAADVGAVLAIDAYERANGLDAANLTQAQSIQWLGVAAPVVLLAFVLKLALFAPVAGLVMDRAGTPRAQSALAAVARRPVTLLALGLVLTLAYLLGFLMLVVGALVFLHWFQYAPVALADRGKGLGDAFDASRRFAKARRAYGFTALVLFVLVASFLVAQALEIGTLRLLAAQGVGGPWVEALVGGIAQWLVAPAVAILPASYWVVAAQAQPKGEEDAQPAAPTERTTKCPRCGTLIAYVPTGEPVAVECPSCGHKGKVL